MKLTELTESFQRYIERLSGRVDNPWCSWGKLNKCTDYPDVVRTKNVVWFGCLKCGQRSTVNAVLFHSNGLMHRLRGMCPKHGTVYLDIEYNFQDPDSERGSQDHDIDRDFQASDERFQYPVKECL